MTAPPGSAAHSARLIAAGELTSEALVRSCLGRVAEQQQADIHAWAHLAESDAIAEARNRDREPREGRPLHGIPVGIKDLTDVAGMPTRYGVARHPGHRPTSDSASAALARSAGAVIMGKTTTTEFGGGEPCATRNPRDVAHSPGGSSAGSAAAVAAGQVPLATGTQTGGSIIRPAAYCGVVGFKPSFGAISLRGTTSPSWTLDTLGVFACDVWDATLFFAAVRGERGLPIPPPGDFRRTVGVFLGPDADRADDCAIDALEAVAAQCTNAGSRILRLDPPPNFRRSLDWQRTISRYESARSLQVEWATQRERLSPTLQEEISEGLSITFRAYSSAKAQAAEFAASMSGVADGCDLILSLAAAGEAPLGLTTTGDAMFNKTWTLLGRPCLSLPVSRGPGGLPLAVQVVGTRYEDDALLAHALWLERITGPVTVD